MLSGGINPSNIDEAKSLSNLNLFGLDLNSGFEIEPGLKNIEQLKHALTS